MTLVTEATVETNLFSAVVRAMSVTLKARAARRAQRLALGELLHMDPARLADLGISADDVLEAMAAPPPAGPLLADRRASRSIAARDAAR